MKFDVQYRHAFSQSVELSERPFLSPIAAAEEAASGPPLSPLPLSPSPPFSVCERVCSAQYIYRVCIRTRGERKVISTFAAAAAAEVPFLLLSGGRSQGKVFRVAIGSIRCGEKKGERGREHTCCYYCCCCSQLHERTSFPSQELL